MLIVFESKFATYIQFVAKLMPIPTGESSHRYLSKFFIRETVDYRNCIRFSVRSIYSVGERVYFYIIWRIAHIDIFFYLGFLGVDY